MIRLRLQSLDEAREVVERLRGTPRAHLPEGEWPLARVLNHCAVSIDCTLHGFPVMKPALIRRSIGPLILRAFLLLIL